MARSQIFQLDPSFSAGKILSQDCTAVDVVVKTEKMFALGVVVDVHC